MAWSGSLSASSAVGSSIIYTPDTGSEGAYTVSAFTAPKKGVYRFQLYGSGGTPQIASGGAGGHTDGYLLLEANQTVYVGAGGPCSAAFVAAVYGSSLAAIGAANLHFVAGAGGGGGTYSLNGSIDRAEATSGGVGGGSSGAAASNTSYIAGGGGGGSQSAGGYAGGGEGYIGSAGAYGTGGGGGSDSSYKDFGGAYAAGGRGGDGYYGGGGGGANASTNSSAESVSGLGAGGGGGSGYVKNASLVVAGRTYTSLTGQGGGAGSGGSGSVRVTYYARAQLPVIYDGVTLERLFFNGTEIESLIFNGTKLFFERMKGGAYRCLKWMVPASS